LWYQVKIPCGAQIEIAPIAIKKQNLDGVVIEVFTFQAINI